MKKFIALIVPTALFLSLTLGMSSVQAEDQTVSQATNIQQEAIYKITPADKEWANFTSKQEKVDATRIPADVLSKMTTDEVVEAVLTYPLLTDIYAFDSTEAGLSVLAEQSDAFRELQTREDAEQKLNERLQMRSLTTENALQPRTIDMLLSDKQISSSQSLQVSAVTGSTATVHTVKTPKGSSVTAHKYSPDFTTAEKNELKRTFLSSYPNAQFVSNATVNYNCHSYAFYSRLTTNPYWIEDPSTYMKDGSYAVVFSPVSASIGTRVYFDHPDYTKTHSAVVTGTPSPGSPAQNFTVTSKWGKAPLFKHVAKDSPYSMNNIKLYNAN